MKWEATNDYALDEDGEVFPPPTRPQTAVGGRYGYFRTRDGGGGTIWVGRMSGDRD